MIWLWTTIFILQFCVATYAFYQRNKYRDSARTLAKEAVESRNIKLPGYMKAMTALEILRILENNEGPAPLAFSVFKDWAIVKVSQNPLTPHTSKAQDTPKRYTGSQLRRISEQENAAVWDSLQERPNSEILQERENG